MDKNSYGFEDLALIRKRERELLERGIKAELMLFRICLRCGERKLTFHFSIDKRMKGDRSNVCKDCRSKESLRYYYDNKDRISRQSQKYRDDHKENRRLYNAKYREDHTEFLKNLAKRWYERNKKRIKKRNLKYYHENREACQAVRELWREKNREEIKKYNREYRRARVLVK